MIIIFHGIKIEYKYKSVKYLRLSVKPIDNVHLSIPHGTLTEEVYKFLEKQKEWIEDSLKKWKKRSEEAPEDRPKCEHNFEDGDV